MINIFQISSSICYMLIVLVAALIITITASLNMIEKKRINIFLPFFIFGLGVCLTSAFMFYDFFGVAIDMFYVFSFVSVVEMFFILWGQER